MDIRKIERRTPAARSDVYRRMIEPNIDDAIVNQYGKTDPPEDLDTIELDDPEIEEVTNDCV